MKNVCEICGKVYKHRSGLSRHRKQCVLINKKSIEKKNENSEKAEKKMVTKKPKKFLKNV